MFIKSIQIKNFRSILHEKIFLKDLVVLIGNNDAGKSNYIKALNLFFNNQTDFNTPFNFSNDYCKSAKAGSKMAKEITICIEFIPPYSYKEKENIFWTKVWRSSGELKEKSKKTFKNKKSMNTSRSRVNHWIEHLKFRYVPAIKSDFYFQELLGDLNDSFAESVEKDIQTAATSFTEKIQISTNQITSELLSRLNLNSNLILPNDLRKIFQTLEFNTRYEDIELSLKNRGDGIKSRHIPVILKFLAEQDNKTRNQGAPKIDTIWGFEEPENNLELLKAFDLAKDFYDYSSSIQIIISTHSPAFYTLGKLDVVFPSIKGFDQNRIDIYFIDKDTNSTYTSISKKITGDSKFLDEKIGLLPIITPYIIDRVNEIQELDSKYKCIREELGDVKKPIVLTEGKTDVMILTQAWSVLYTDMEMPFRILSCNTTPSEEIETAGASMLKQSLSSHRPELPIFIGLFDYDDEGIKEFDALSKNFTLHNGKKIHRNKKCAAMCIPRISNREEYYKAKNLPIEFIFPDKYIDKKCNGIGLEFRQEKIITRIGCKITEEKETTELYYRKITNNKTYFADRIVKTFPSEAFDNFRVLFEELDSILTLLIAKS